MYINICKIKLRKKNLDLYKQYLGYKAHEFVLENTIILKIIVGIILILK